MVYLSFYSLLFASLLFTAICKASSDSRFGFLHFFSMGIVLIPVSCTLGYSFGFMHSVNFGMCLIHEFTIEDSFSALKTLHASPVYPSLLLTTGNRWSAISIILRFPDYRMVVYNWAFLCWILSLTHMHFKFPPRLSIAWYLISFCTESYFIVEMYHSLSIYLINDVLIGSKFWQLWIKLP